MKRVVSNSEVPHLWAHQTQSDARNAKSSIFFEGKTIYSYGRHFPIATFVENVQGESAVLFTTGEYSVTTSGHKSLVRRSINHIANVFHVPLKTRIWGVTVPDEDHVTDYARRIKDLSDSVARSREGYTRTWKLGSLTDLVSEANRYCEFFGHATRFEVPSDFETLKKELSALRATAIKEAKERQKQIDKDNQEYVDAWLQGDSSYFPHAVKKVYLRVRGDEVETSMGARFPIEHAAKGLRIVRKIRETQQPYKRNGHTIHLGHYAIDEIDVKGNVKAGCHYVTYEAIERIAPVLEGVAQ